jgi:CheY-like chemotaxis protein
MAEKEILIVDDDNVILELFQQAFMKAGYTVMTAASSKEALEILRKTYCNVIFLDLNLPVMNGLELGRRIKKLNPMAILFAVTGYASVFQLTDCLEAGFEDYFIKPVDIQVLYKAAEHAFEKIDRWKIKNA